MGMNSNFGLRGKILNKYDDSRNFGKSGKFSINEF